VEAVLVELVVLPVVVDVPEVVELSVEALLPVEDVPEVDELASLGGGPGGGPCGRPPAPLLFNALTRFWISDESVDEIEVAFAVDVPLSLLVSPEESVDEVDAVVEPEDVVEAVPNSLAMSFNNCANAD
jgi:hypothetical protein